MDAWIDCPHCAKQIDVSGGLTIRRMVTVCLPREPEGPAPVQAEPPAPNTWTRRLARWFGGTT